MKRAETLREQARPMRTLAGGFESESIRYDLVGLVDRGNELPTNIEISIRQTLSQPIDVRKRDKGGPA